jgi:beta-phosphoglucomutase-like phosphatase (HAD superfamily)
MATAMQLAALIFDVDGTLAETERDGHRIAFNRAFADVGLGWHWDVATYGRLLAVTGGKERMTAYWRERKPARPPDDDLIRRIHRRKTEIYGDIVAAGGIPLRPGVARLLAQARENGLRLAIATTTSPENVDALLRIALGADGVRRFDCIGAGDIVRAKKPAPDIYDWVLVQLGLAPEQCIAFEDSMPGLAAARGARLATIVTESEYTRGGAFDGALAVLDDLGEPQAPASGRAFGKDWRGVVDVETLLHWSAAAAQ